MDLSKKYRYRYYRLRCRRCLGTGYDCWRRGIDLIPEHHEGMVADFSLPYIITFDRCKYCKGKGYEAIKLSCERIENNERFN